MNQASRVRDAPLERHSHTYARFARVRERTQLRSLNFSLCVQRKWQRDAQHVVPTTPFRVERDNAKDIAASRNLTIFLQRVGWFFYPPPPSPAPDPFVSDNARSRMYE